MERNEDCKIRKIAKASAETPLLVPSFSSTAFPRATDVKFAIEDLKSRLAVSSLVSAYDINHGYANNEIGFSDLVFVDSGNYERRFLEGQGLQVEWNRSLHESTIDSLVSLTQMVIVNFDEPGPIPNQAESARSFFNARPKFVSDFLCKPTTGESDYIDLEELERNLAAISDFDILGVTEKELGASPIERCRNLSRLRKSLESADKDTPIHVFGCLEPVSIVLLTLSGGDIFDGLTWARYATLGDLLVYPGSAQLFHEEWSIEDLAFQRSLAIRNLDSLTELMFRIRSFTYSRDFAELGLTKEAANTVKSIMERARVGNG